MNEGHNETNSLSELHENDDYERNRNVSMKDIPHIVRSFDQKLQNSDLQSIKDDIDNIVEFLGHNPFNIADIAQIILSPENIPLIITLIFIEEYDISISITNTLSMIFEINVGNEIIHNFTNSLINHILTHKNINPLLSTDIFHQIINQSTLDDELIIKVISILIDLINSNHDMHIMGIVNSIIEKYHIPFEKIEMLYHILLNAEPIIYNSYSIYYILLGNFMKSFPELIEPFQESKLFFNLMNLSHTYDSEITNARLYFVKCMLANPASVTETIENFNFIGIFSSQPNGESISSIVGITKRLIEHNPEYSFKLIEFGLIHWIIEGLSPDYNLNTKIIASKSLLAIIELIGNEATKTAMNVGFITPLVQVLYNKPFYEGFKLIKLAIDYSLSLGKKEARDIINIIHNEDLVESMDDIELENECAELWEIILKDIEKIRKMKPT